MEGASVKSQSQQRPDLQAIIERYQLTHGDPCASCGCEVYRSNMYQWFKPVCLRCYPPRGYHEYSDQIDTLYPRKKS